MRPRQKTAEGQLEAWAYRRLPFPSPCAKGTLARQGAGLCSIADSRIITNCFSRDEELVESARACSAPIESGGFSWGRGWESLSALIRFWEAGRCRRPILGRC